MLFVGQLSFNSISKVCTRIEMGNFWSAISEHPQACIAHIQHRNIVIANRQTPMVAAKITTQDLENGTFLQFPGKRM